MNCIMKFCEFVPCESRWLWGDYPLHTWSRTQTLIYKLEPGSKMPGSTVMAMQETIRSDILYCPWGEIGLSATVPPHLWDTIQVRIEFVFWVVIWKVGQNTAQNGCVYICWLCSSYLKVIIHIGNIEFLKCPSEYVCMSGNSSLTDSVKGLVFSVIPFIRFFPVLSM